MSSLGKATVLIGGGTGFIGSMLARTLRGNGHHVLIVSRQPGPFSITWTELQEKGLPSGVTAVVNTAGQNVFDIRRSWTPGFKQNVWASRVSTTLKLARAIDAVPESEKPKVFMCMSGVGYYPPSEETEYTEGSPGGNFDFLSSLVTDWEAASELEKSANVRRVILRSGVVVGREGGVVHQMYWPFWFGGGGAVGSGKQFFPWIHINDLTNFMVYGIVENLKVSGIYNAVAPQIITNHEFAKALGLAMWRPWFFRIPSFFLNWAFHNERAKIMTEGQKVIGQRILDSGYKFQYGNIQDACKQCARIQYLLD